MIQDLVIPLNTNNEPFGDEKENPPILYSNIKQLNKNIVSDKANPKELINFGYGVFEWAWKPEVEYNKTVIYIGIQKHSDNIFRPSFKIIDATLEEIQYRKDLKAEEIRADRNFKLTLSDYSQLPNAPQKLKDKAVDWENYRQQLRDITLQQDFPFKVIWPIKPE